MLGLTPKATTTTIPNHDDWDSEIEVSETDFGLRGEDSVSYRKARASASVRKARKRVRVRETLQQEQERMLDKIIRE